MRPVLLAAHLVLLTVVASAAHAQPTAAPTTPATATAITPVRVATPSTPASDAAAQVVNDFMAALASGRLEAARALMAPNAIVVANGQVLGNRDAYIDGAAKGDAAALKSVERVLVHRDAQVGADFGWVLSEKRVRAVGAPEGPSEAVIETMLLARTAAGWRITHIHWSTRQSG